MRSVSPAKITALAKIARAHGIAKLCIPGLRLEFVPVEPAAAKEDRADRDPRRELREQVAEMLGGANPDDVQLPNEWSEVGGTLREEVQKFKEKSK